MGIDLYNPRRGDAIGLKMPGQPFRHVAKFLPVRCIDRKADTVLAPCFRFNSNRAIGPQVIRLIIKTGARNVKANLRPAGKKQLGKDQPAQPDGFKEP